MKCEFHSYNRPLPEIIVQAKPDTNAWTNAANLNSEQYLEQVIPGLYAMRCSRIGIYRVGVCGINSASNNASRRLKQVQIGMKDLGIDWSYAFLAKLPDCIIEKARECEIFYQSSMYRKFRYIGISHIRLNEGQDEKCIENEATDIMSQIYANCGVTEHVLPTLAKLSAWAALDDLRQDQ